MKCLHYSSVKSNIWLLWTRRTDRRAERQTSVKLVNRLYLETHTHARTHTQGTHTQGTPTLLPITYSGTWPCTACSLSHKITNLTPDTAADSSRPCSSPLSRVSLAVTLYMRQTTPRSQVETVTPPDRPPPFTAPCFTETVPYHSGSHTGVP